MATVHPSIKTLVHPARLRVIKNSSELKVVERLPKAYQNYYKRWKDEEKETPVHWVPRTEKWEKDAYGVVKPVQNLPIPVKYPHQHNTGLWGGEGVVLGTVKKRKYTKPVPRFWVPRLKETVVYSEILDKYLSVVVTERALRLIDECYGFDNYLLKTPEYDVKSVLALKIKRRILLALVDKDFAHDNPEKKESLYEKYKEYIVPREEADWVGLTVEEAVAKQLKIEKAKKMAETVPLKYELRRKFLEKLAEEKISGPQPTEPEPSLLSKLNPFARSKSEQRLEK